MNLKTYIKLNKEEKCIFDYIETKYATGFLMGSSILIFLFVACGVFILLEAPPYAFIFEECFVFITLLCILYLIIERFVNYFKYDRKFIKKYKKDDNKEKTKSM